MKEKLAKLFAEFLLREIGQKNFNKVIEKNKYVDEGICSSHNYCDANMVMDKAMKKLGMNTDNILQNEKILNLWNSAWLYAKENNFFNLKK